MKYEKASVIVLINPEKKLLCQLRDNKPWIICPNQWGIVGGGVEEGETELEAIKREVFEEISLDIEPVKKIGEYVYKNILASVFLGKIGKKAEEIDLKEGQKVEYFSFDELKHLKMSEVLRKFILDHQKEILDI